VGHATFVRQANSKQRLGMMTASCATQENMDQQQETTKKWTACRVLLALTLLTLAQTPRPPACHAQLALILGLQPLNA